MRNRHKLLLFVMLCIGLILALHTSKNLSRNSDLHLTYVGAVPIGYDHSTLLAYLNHHLENSDQTVSRRLLTALNKMQQFDEIKIIQQGTNEFIIKVKRKKPILILNFQKILFQDKSIALMGPVAFQDILNLKSPPLSPGQEELIYNLIQLVNDHQMAVESISMPSYWSIEIMTAQGVLLRFNSDLEFQKIKKIMKQSFLDTNQYKLIDARYEKGFAFTMKSHPSAKI